MKCKSLKIDTVKNKRIIAAHLGHGATCVLCMSSVKFESMNDDRVWPANFGDCKSW